MPNHGRSIHRDFTFGMVSYIDRHAEEQQAGDDARQEEMRATVLRCAGQTHGTLEAGPTSDYERYVLLHKVQLAGRKLISNFPPLPPSLILGVQLLLVRLFHMNMRLAIQELEQSTKSILVLREGEAFIDVGASVGGWSLWASKQIGRTGVVLALEPNPLAFAWLRRNAAGARNIIPLRVAAHSESAVIELWIVNNSMSSTESRETVGELMPGMRRGRLVSVNAVRLDSLAARMNPSQGIVIKIDVEGAEMNVLRGATGIMPRVRAAVVEVHSRILRQEVDRFLRDHGFSTQFLGLEDHYPGHVVGFSRA